MTIHHFTVDVEEYFQVSAFEANVERAHWETMESRVVHGVSTLVDLLAERDVRGTFFILGWVAERTPEVVSRIAAAGHEIASHGWDHTRVTEQGPDEFRAAVRRTKRVLEDLSGAPVIGFRAPSFSIVPGLEWALDILVEEGHRYDSSLYPVRRNGYGYAAADRDPHWLDLASGRLAEFPPATVRFGNMNVPAGGGAYFRLLPYGVVRRALQVCEQRDVPGTFYIHPWEVDPDQPRVDVPWWTRVRHYGGMAATPTRLRRLLGEFRFQPIAESLATL